MNQTFPRLCYVFDRYIYNIIGIDKSGHKDLLGMYIAHSEGANFWFGVLTDLQNRGVEDILIASVWTVLKAFPMLFRAYFPIRMYSSVLSTRYATP